MADEYIRKADAVGALADYIMDVNKVYSTGKLTQDDCIDCAESVLDDLSSADVAPVVHGKWIGYDDTERFTAQCSLCGNVIDTRFGSNFCPYCGAKMDKE